MSPMSLVSSKVFCNFNVYFKILARNRVLNISKMPFYAVAKGRMPGIFQTWADCEAQVKGFSGARYKKFDSVTAAQDFIETEGGKKTVSKPTQNKSKPTYQPVPEVNNLKRTYATSTKITKEKNDKKEKFTKRKSKVAQSSDSEENSDDGFSDGSDDINTILMKQMDDIEKRLKGFEKGVDKIVKKNKSKSSNRKTILIEPPQPKKSRKSSSNSNLEFEEDNEGYVQVYTDGACSSNGRSAARAGLGVYWGDGHALNTSEPVSGRATNNCGEIQAATRAIKLALQNNITKLAINTDSQFLINSVTKWMPGWKRKGWKLSSGEPVKNEVDFKDLDSVQNQLQIKWNYVEAHRGIHGNEMADQLAKAGAAMYDK